VSVRLALPAAVEAVMLYQGINWKGALPMYSRLLESSRYDYVGEWTHDCKSYHSIEICPWRGRDVRKHVVFSFEGIRVAVHLEGWETPENCEWRVTSAKIPETEWTAALDVYFDRDRNIASSTAHPCSRWYSMYWQMGKDGCVEGFVRYEDGSFGMRVRDSEGWQHEVALTMLVTGE